MLDWRKLSKDERLELVNRLRSERVSMKAESKSRRRRSSKKKKTKKIDFKNKELEQLFYSSPELQKYLAGG